MAASTKLSNAIKALCYLYESYPDPKNSAEISKRIGVNASKIRMILSMLTKNEIVESTKGTSGGFLLKKNAKDIHLQEVYCAIEDRKAFHLNVTKKNGHSADETSKYNNYFLDLFAEIQVDIENKMKKISLIDVYNNVH